MTTCIKATDHLGKVLEIPKPLERIISLVPSQTELLFHLGLEKEIIGITRYCLHPKSKVKDKINVGGTKKLDIPLICSLHPQLIIANKEENSREQIEVLAKKFPLWVSDVSNLDQAIHLIEDLGNITDRTAAAHKLCDDIKRAFEDLAPPSVIRKTLYLIWHKPFMTVGQDTFIHLMMSRAGFQNVIRKNRYPQLNAEQIAGLEPEIILLSSEPFPFSKRHRREMQTICPQAKVHLVDGEMFSWYGSRILKAARYFKGLRAKI